MRPRRSANDGAPHVGAKDLGCGQFEHGQWRGEDCEYALSVMGQAQKCFRDLPAKDAAENYHGCCKEIPFVAAVPHGRAGTL